MADFADMLVTPVSFSNPATNVITKAESQITDMISKLTSLDAAAIAATTPPVPPLLEPIAITIDNLDLLNLSVNIALFQSNKSKLQLYRTHTNALSNVDVGDTEPSYNFLLSASGTIQNAAELKQQLANKGASPDASFGIVVEVGGMDVDSIMSSVSPSLITEISQNVDDITSHMTTMTEYTDLLSAFTSRDKVESERLIELYAPKLATLVMKSDELVKIYDVCRTNDITNYNKIKAASVKLSSVALMFSGLSDPLLSKNMGNISG